MSSCPCSFPGLSSTTGTHNPECPGGSMALWPLKDYSGKKKVNSGLNSNKFPNDVSFGFLSINSYGSLRNLELLAVLFLKGDVVKIAAVVPVSPSWQPRRWRRRLPGLINSLIKTAVVKHNGHSVITRKFAEKTSPAISNS